MHPNWLTCYKLDNRNWKHCGSLLKNIRLDIELIFFIKETRTRVFGLRRIKVPTLFGLLKSES